MRGERCVIKMPFAQKRVWPQLKHLSLSNLATSKKDFISLLEFHSETLQTVELGNVSLWEDFVDSGEKSWSPALKAMRRLPFLRDVTLWEISG